MTITSFFKELYSLDILDTRFTTSSSTPLKLVNGNASNKATVEKDGKSSTPTDVFPPKWRTPEFYFYALVFLFCVPQMYWAVVEVSQRKTHNYTHFLHWHGFWKKESDGGGVADSPNYSKYEHLLSQGWLFGRKVVRRCSQLSYSIPARLM